jgi:hypothetical protein
MEEGVIATSEVLPSHIRHCGAADNLGGVGFWCHLNVKMAVDESCTS